MNDGAMLEVKVSSAAVALLLSGAVMSDGDELTLTAEQARMLGRQLLTAADHHESMAQGADIAEQAPDVGESAAMSTDETRASFDRVFGRDPGVDE